MGRPLPAPVRDDRAEQERTNALRAERRVHLLAEGAEGHVTGYPGDCPECSLTYRLAG